MSKNYTIEEVTLIQRGTNLNDEICCTVKFAECSKPVAVFAHKELGSAFEKELNQRLEDGEFGEFTFPPSDYPVYPKFMVELDAEARATRDELLLKSDWTEVSQTFTLEQRNAWKTYRQALRDVPDQPSFPWEVNWPSKP